MRFVILLLGTSQYVHAAWLRWSNNRENVWAAQETVRVGQDPVGWTPVPTPAPGGRKESQVALEKLKRQAEPSVPGSELGNPDTCGWFSGASASPFVCQEGYTCSTNWKGIVACVSSTITPFLTTCYDYSYATTAQCNDQTGCCQDLTQPYCGLYTWPGNPGRHMYRCFEQRSYVTLLDAPENGVVSITGSIVEPLSTGSASTKANESKSPLLQLPPTLESSSTATTTRSTLSNTTKDYSTKEKNTSFTSTSSSPGTSSSPPLSVTATDHSALTTSNTPGSIIGDDSSNKVSLIGTIVGIVVGALLLIPLLFFVIRKLLSKRKSKKDNKEEDAKSVISQSSLESDQSLGNLESQPDATNTRAELEGTPGEERGHGINVRKPELEGTPGVLGSTGVYVRRRAELEACSRAAPSQPRSAMSTLSMLEFLLHPFTRPHIVEPSESTGQALP
ncbi:hypothetical protein GGR51DRAFT_321995 [Nemania sp. FL0031]|nr:hypothetical protein GGR51DRAFT_321995 [Nemania sp. FL0031]